MAPPRAAPVTEESLTELVVSMSGIQSLPKLTDRGDYRAWKSQLEMYLGLNGGNDLLPGGVYATREDVPEALERQWLEKQRKAILLVKSTLSPTVDLLVEGEHTVAGMLARAKEEYEDSGVTTLLKHLGSLYDNGTESFTTVRALANQMKVAQDGLVAAGYPAPEPHMVVQFTKRLDQVKFGQWLTTFWALNQTIPTMSAAVRAAETEEIRLNQEETNAAISGEGPVALVAQGRGGGRKRGPTVTATNDEARRQKSCTHCQRNGHLQEECWRLHPDKMPKHIQKRRAENAKKRAEEKAQNEEGTSTLGMVSYRGFTNDKVTRY